MTQEEPLAGGAVKQVVRVGDTVRRVQDGNSGFVHRLLQHLEARGFAGAPRFLGVDERGREILTYVEGHVDWDRRDAPRLGATDLAAAARLTRAFHDLTAGTPLAGRDEVVCHNDLSVRNSVFSAPAAPRELVAFIDWDNAAPGRRLHDVAHLAWQFVELGPTHPDAAQAGAHLRLIADAYGLGPERADLVETILWWQDRSWRGIEAGAEAGDAAMQGLRDRGAVSDVRASFAWTREHRVAFEAAVGS
ncbi:MAG TPA: phosphotransferase [Caulobacteraceae bacterium]|nr:phosphotransferase [Caulobacteraceae bacterium]